MMRVSGLRRGMDAVATGDESQRIASAIEALKPTAIIGAARSRDYLTGRWSRQCHVSTIAPLSSPPRTPPIT
jgi:hypothetical protein